MSSAIKLTEIAHGGRTIEARTVADIAAFTNSATADWIAVSASNVDFTSPTPAGQFQHRSADVILLASTDPRSWFWNNAAPHTIAALGLPHGTIALRREACRDLSSMDANTDATAGLLWHLTECNCSFAAPDAPDLERCDFTVHSQIPANDRTHDGGWLLHALSDVTPSRFVKGGQSGAAATAVQSGVLLINDFLDASHQRSQSIEGHSNGDYWHGIMHRREPDFGNAKYWFRRVGHHPVLDTLADVARKIAAGFDSPDVANWLSKITTGGWDAFAAVDLSEAAHRNPTTDLHAFAERLLWAEMILLLAHCCREAE